VKFKIMAGTLSIIVMLSTTPTLAQAHIAADTSRVLLLGQSEIVGSTLQTRAKALDIDISGLTNDQVRTKIKKAERANTLTNLLDQAKTLGIGVTLGTSGLYTYKD